MADADLPALLSLAEIFVYPSLSEGFGLPVLEAMACGAPVACSNISSLPEVAGDAALLFDPTDTVAIAAALELLVGNPNLQQDCKQRGLKRAAQFSWEYTARQTLEVYQSIAHASNAFD